MKQLLCILKREVLVKVRSKSYYLFVIISPILFLIPIIFSILNNPKQSAFPEKNNVGVYSKDFISDSAAYRGLKFSKLSDSEIRNFNSGNFGFDKYIGVVDLHLQNKWETTSIVPIKLYMEENCIKTNQMYLKDIESFINSEIIYRNCKEHDLPDSLATELSNIRNVYPIIYTTSENSRLLSISSAMAYILGMLLYIMFILYNNNIMRSVSEEKNNKLAEVLSVFVKPINLMLGKIIGLGIASFIQLLMWIIVFGVYLKLIFLYESNFISYTESGNNFLSVTLSSISELPLMNLCLFLPLFFIFGILLNGSISTIIAIYSTRKNSNYMMFFGNILNLLAIYFGMYVATSPDSHVSTFLSYFPIFSYLTIPVLLPYGISTVQVVISLFILIFTVLGSILLSGYLYKRSISA